MIEQLVVYNYYCCNTASGVYSNSTNKVFIKNPSAKQTV